MSSACHIVLKTINHYGFQVKEVSDILDITLSTILRSITERAWSSNYEELHSKLRELFEEHFSICTFIKFEKLEHCAIEKLKVILLVLYLTLQNDFRICKNFMSNIPTADLDNKTANQLQVLFEKLSIWRRKHITEEHYLDNLMMENLGGNITEIETVPSSSKWIFSSPTVYSNSPKPNLKSYLQSPQFRREGTNQKLKNLQLKINSLEDANYNLKETNRLDLKDFEVSKLKLERVIEKLKQEVQYLQDHSEGLTHQVHLGEEEKRLQFVELKKNVSNLTTENEFLKSQIKLVEKDNADLVDKNKNLRNRLILTETELCNLNSDNEELRMTRLDNASIIEEITFELKESKKQLEELQNKLFCLQESDPKSSTLYEISFDGPPHSMEIDTSVLDEENMKKGFTDIKLAETEEKLTEVKKQLMLANETNDRHKLDLMELTTKVELEKKEREMAQYNCDQLQELILEKENKLKDLLADMQLQAENLRDEKSILMSQFQKEILKFEISNKEKDSHLQKKEIESNEMKDLHQKEILILTENMNLEKQQFLNQIEQLNDQLSNTILERNSSLNKFELLTSEYEEAQQKYQDKVQLLEKKDEEKNKMIMELESEAHQTKLNLRNYQLDKEHLISQLQKELENTCLKIAQMEIDFQVSFATIEKEKNGLNEEFGRLNLLNKQLEEKQEILFNLNANLNGEIVNLTEKNAKLQELIKSIEKENQSSIECHLMEKENLIIENDGLKLKNNDNIEEISSMVNKIENLNSQLKLKVESHENLLKLYEQKSLQYNELSQKQIKVESKLKSLNEDYEKKIEKSINENKTLKAQNEITKTQNEDLLFQNISNKEIILANQKEIEILNFNLKLESDKYEEKIENLKLDAHQTISSLKSQLSLAEEKLTALNLAQQTLINLNDNFVTEKHCLLAQIQDHEKQVTIWENKILKIKEECDLLSANISENKIVITELSNENILIKDKIKQSEEAFKTEETAYQIKAAELHSLCDERLKRTQELADQLSVSQFELSKKNQEFDLIEKTLNKKICTLQNIISEKENTIAELNNEKILCMEKVTQSEEMFKAEEAAHKIKASELQSLCEERLKNAQALSDQLSVSQSELNTKSQEFNLIEETLNKQICALQNVISEKENMIAELNNEKILCMEKVTQSEEMFKAEEAAHKIKASELQSLCEERLKNAQALSDQLSVSQSELNTKSQEFNLIEETLNKQICALQNVISEKENMIAELNNEKILCMEKVTQSEEMFKAEEAAHKIKASELQSLCEERLKNAQALSDQLSVSQSELNTKSQEFNLIEETLNKQICALQNVISEKENMIAELNNEKILCMEKVTQSEEMFKAEESAHKIKASELQSLCEERLKNAQALSDQLSVSQSELNTKSQEFNLIEETLNKQICALQNVISEKENMIAELNNEKILCMEKVTQSEEMFKAEEAAHKIKASELQSLCEERLKNVHALSDQLSVSKSEFNKKSQEFNLMAESLNKKNCSLQNIVSEKENMITELNNKNVLFMEKVKQFEEMFKTEEAAHKIKAAELQSLCEERLKNSLTLSDQLSVFQSELSAKNQSLNLIEETIRKEICTLQKIISEKKNIIVELSNENVLFMEKHKLSVELQTEEPAYKINASEFQFLGDEGLKNMSLLSNQLSVSQSKLSYTICELSLMEETLKKEISSLKKNALKMSIELESSVNTIRILNSDLNRLKEESQLTWINNQQKFETLKCENKLLEENFKECMQLSNKNSDENILLQEKIAELGKDVEKYLMEKDVLLKKLECQTCSAVESKQVIESLRAELKSCMSRFENEKENLLNRANKSESEAVNATDSLKMELIKMEEQAKKKEQEKEHFSSKLNNYELIIKSLEDNLKATEKKSKNNIDMLETKIMDKEAEYETKIKVLECKLENNETKYKNDIMTLESKIQKTNILTTQEKEKLKSKILDAKIESENQIKLLESKLKEKESEYETTISNLYKDKHDFESKTVQMLAENKQMLLTISEQESCLDENKKVLNSLQEKVDNLTKDLDVKNNQICNIQEESEHKSEKINLLNNHVEELSGELTKLEKVLEIEKTSVLDLKEKVRKEEYEKQQISSALEQLKKSFDAKSDFESHEKQCMSNLEQHAQQTIKALQCQINTLIDKNEFEKQTLLEKLEIKNKLMDESASTIRQLSEKIKLADEKAASDREKLNTFKTAYRTEIGSIMKKVEEQSAEHKNFELLSKKYELLKRKMKETMEKNTELSSLSEAQEIQLKKQKETLDEISKSKNELETAELTQKKTHLEVKQKLIVSEGINKRLAAEKRSLETQLQFAETSLRDLQKHANRTNLPNVSGFAKPNTSSLTRSSTTRLSLKTQQPSQTNLTNNTAVKKQYSKPSIHLAPPPRTTRSYKSCTAVIPGKGNEVKVAVGPNSNDKLGHLERESLGRSVPKTMSSMFACEDEEEDHISFSNPKNLNNLVEGKMTLDVDYDWRRVSELQRRNTLCLPHLRSAYPAEMQFMPSEAFTDDQLREGQAMDDEQFVDLAEAADLLDINSPPASNLRKRKSSIDSQISISSSGGKRSRRTSTSYSRPGPPTPGRRGSGRGPYKENDNRLSIASRDSLVSLRSSMHTPLIDRQDPSSTRNSFGSPKTLALRSYKGLSPANKGARTPGSAMKQMFSRIKKSPWRKLHNDPDTDMKSLGDSTGSASNSKLKIFRKPFGGKNYNVLSASLRANDVENLNQTPGSGRILRHSIMENTPTTRKTNGK